MGNRKSTGRQSSNRRGPGERSLERRGETRDRREKFLIVCEGITEWHYFRGFPVSPKAEIYSINAKGGSPSAILEKAIEKKQEDEDIYDQVWCVFDLDVLRNKREEFSKIAALAKKKKIQIAYSNENFELWFLLHFGTRHCNTSGKKYCETLASLLKPKEYDKGKPGMYGKLLDSQPTAIAYAKTLLNNYDIADPLNNIPSTTVHELVEQLNRFLHDRVY